MLAWFIGGLREADTALGKALSYILIILVVSCFLVLGVAFAYAVWAKRYRDTTGKQHRETAHEVARRLVDAANVFAAMPRENLEGLLMESYDQDLDCVATISNFIGVELLHLNSSSFREARLPPRKPSMLMDTKVSKDQLFSSTSMAYEQELVKRADQFRSSCLAADQGTHLSTSEKCSKSESPLFSSASQSGVVGVLLGTEGQEVQPQEEKCFIPDLLDIAESGGVPARPRVSKEWRSPCKTSCD